MGKRNWLLIMGCPVAAFIGGAESNWVLSAEVAAAQEKQGTEAAPVLTVSGVRVVDKNGKERLGLGMAADGSVGLYQYDENGELRVTLAVLEKGPGLLLSNDKGKFIAGLIAVSADEGIRRTTPTLLLVDDEDESEVHIKILATIPMLTFERRHEDEPDVAMWAGPGAARLVLGGKGGGVTVNSTPSLMVRDEKGKVIWEAP